MDIIIPGILIASVLSLDTTHAFQTMLSQPVFACPLLGLLFGNPLAGLLMGMMFELIFLKVIPMGGNAFPENNSAAMSGTILWIALSRAFPDQFYSFVPVVLVVSVLLAFLGMKLTVYHRRKNILLLERASRDIGVKTISSAYMVKLILYSMVHFVLLIFLLDGLMVSAMYWLLRYLLSTGWFTLPSLLPAVWISAFIFSGIAVLFELYFGKDR